MFWKSTRTRLQMSKTDRRVFLVFTIVYTLLHSAYMFFYEWLREHARYRMYISSLDTPETWGLAREGEKYHNYLVRSLDSKYDACTIIAVVSVILIALLFCYLITHLPPISTTVIGLVFSLVVSRGFLYLLAYINFAPGESLATTNLGMSIQIDYGPLFTTEWEAARYVHLKGMGIDAMGLNAMKLMGLGFCLYLVVKLVYSYMIYIRKKKRSTI